MHRQKRQHNTAKRGKKSKIVRETREEKSDNVDIEAVSEKLLACSGLKGVITDRSGLPPISVSPV